MSKFRGAVLLPPVAGSPSSHVDGQIWYDSTAGRIRGQENGTVQDVGVPIGVPLPYLGSSAPNGYLLLDGSAVSRTTYAALFAITGTAWGVGDGSTTFNLPDFRGRSPIGKGTHADVDALGDSDSITLASRTPVHTHGPGTLGGTTGGPSNNSAATALTGSVAANNHTHNITLSTGASASSSGGGYIVTNWIVKY